MIRRDFPMFFAGVVLIALVGCSTNTDLGGSGVPNSRPETRVTGQPPTLLEAGYTVHFNWTGSDPDGKIVGYEWKISDNGLDGISPRDTLTTDPVTGATINPWHFTTANDTLFYVLADQEGFEGDPEGMERSFRTHSLFIRSMDDDGAVDPSPALISFTSTTIIPTCRGVYPSTYDIDSYKSIPSDVNVGYLGADSDYELKSPTGVRFLWKSAIYEGTGIPFVIGSRYYFELYQDELIDFADPEWSDWKRYPTDEDRRIVPFDGNVDRETYLFAVQVRDTAGAVSLGKGYQRQVLNFKVFDSSFSPDLVLFEAYQGAILDPVTVEIAADQPLNFSWTASAARYNGTISSMRHGWDLVDVEDVNDPGWGPPPGLTENNRYAAERSYSSGEHSFWLRVVDYRGAVSVLRYGISIIPYVSTENQLGLALVDQVKDLTTSRWPNTDIQPSIYYDRQEHRNGFWRFLSAEGGVAGFNWMRDAFQTGEDANNLFEYVDSVNYKAVLIFARSHREQSLFAQFRPTGNSSPFVWLAPYQNKAGNLFLVGSRSMESFLEERNYMLPIIFDSTIESYDMDGDSYVTGFGESELFDGSMFYKGPKMYPFATAGITALDWSSPIGNKFIYGRNVLASSDRNTKCSGLKQLRLVPSFKNEHLIGTGVVADTISTNPQIDWRDIQEFAAPDIGTLFPFSGDEFVNEKIVDRPTSLIIQECANGYEGLCVEPMFTGIARMDWMREKMWSEGDNQWPASTFDNDTLKVLCGDMALTSYLDDTGVIYPLASARSTNKVYGWLSHKMVENKPSGKADVYWGFDPYRFEATESRKAIMWVMQYFGLPVRTGETR